jgi:GTP cyclohydrolase FolE2
VSPAAVQTLDDVQSKPDGRGVTIDEVGVAGVRVPVRVAGGRSAERSTVAEFEMTVALDAGTKGTHMSRFVEALAAWGGEFDGRALARSPLTCVTDSTARGPGLSWRSHTSSNAARR